jgi:hypothetical protein
MEHFAHGPTSYLADVPLGGGGPIQRLRSIAAGARRWLDAALARLRARREWKEIRDVRLGFGYAALTARMNPAERGRDAGSQQLPPSSATVLDQFHLELVATASELIAGQAGRRGDLLRERGRRMMAISLGDPHAEVKTVLRRFSEVSVPDVVERALPGIVRGFSDSETSRREYLRFKAVHNRLAEAKRPSGAALTAMLFLVVIVVEAGLNAAFVRDYLPYGVAGALAVGLTTVLINSGVGYAIGATLLKRLNYIGRFRRQRILAALGITASVSLLLLFLVFVTNARTWLAHRDAVTGSPVTGLPVPGAGSPLLSWNYWLSEPTSIMMLIVSVLFAGASIAIGYWTTGDLYPGYWRRVPQ